jgi:ligand-binding sensor domain-containing protein
MFYTEDAGRSWKQSSRGLNERDVLSLQQAPSGTLVAGTNHGVFYLASVGGTWMPAAMIRGPLPQWREKQAETDAQSSTTSKSTATKKTAAKRTVPAKKPVAKAKAPVEAVIPIDKAPRIRAIEIADTAWFAATNEGLFVSVDEGRRWYTVPVEGESDFIGIDGAGSGTLTLSSTKRAFLSGDGGKTWNEVKLPQYVTVVYSFTATPNSALWLGTREGALRSTDAGKTWDHLLGGLPHRNVFAIRFDTKGQRLLATAPNTHAVFESTDGGQTWKKTPDAGVSLRAAMSYQGHLLAASTYNGLLVEQGGEDAVASEVQPAKTVASPQ